MRLRQIAFAAADRDAVVDDLRAVLGIAVSFNDPGVAVFGLCNAVLPVGDAFLEVVSPTEAGSAAGRYMQRRGGDCGYMVMVQVDDTDAARASAAALGVRTAWSIDLDDIRGTHFHPRDLGGALLSVDTPRPAAAWRWAGPEWPQRRQTAVVDDLVGTDMACVNPATTAARWATLLGGAVVAGATAHEIALGHGRLRFVAGAAPGQEGVVALDLHAVDRAAAISAAAARSLPHGPDWVRICGTTLRLVK
jgi:hypothetical protein